LEALARRSFGLHSSLAEDLDDDWGYRRLETFAGMLSSGVPQTTHTRMDWVSSCVALNQRLGSADTTAQVDPGRFTAALMRAAQAQGAKLNLGEVTRMVRDGTGERVGGVEIEGEMVEADEVVIAMGPWSQLAKAWMPLPHVDGLKGHSLLFNTGTAVPPQALFLEYRDEDGAETAPEVFPRSDGTTYVCAISSGGPVPADPGVVKPDAGAIERLQSICERISPHLSKTNVIAAQACFRPITRDGLPAIGRVLGLGGALIATGHSVWGILNAPATGEAVAELILDGRARNIDLRPFDPGRFGGAGRGMQ
jgi:glycine/D-amino acid oxidase-like deaminating enzyme